MATSTPDAVLPAEPDGAHLAPVTFSLRATHILQRTAQAFLDDDVTRLGAALAFYTTVAVAPLMVLCVAIAGMFLEQNVARETVVREIRSVIGEPAANAVATIDGPLARREGIMATIMGVVTLLFGALGVFRHLQDALNSIWRARPPRLGFWPMVKHRLSSMAVVLATGFLLLVSLIVSASVSWFATRVLNQMGVTAIYFEISNTVFAFAVITVLFALLFKLLPDTKVPWRHVWLGAVVTAALFTLGKSALSFYLAHANVTSAYGAAGSLVALLLWCYYAAQIVFLGAEFTRITTLSNGGRDFSALETPLERVRLSHVPPTGTVIVQTGKGRRRRSVVPRRRPG
jgi:membrane protein